MEVNITETNASPVEITIQEGNQVSVTSATPQTLTVLDKYSIAGISAETDKTYTHTQGTPASTWNVTHNLSKKPSVTVVDSADNVVVGEVSYLNDNQLTLTFSAGAFSGKAYLN